MKKVRSEAIGFQPNIQIHDAGDRWAISFDLASPRDTKRESRTVFVLRKDIRQLNLQVEGFKYLAAAASEESSGDEKGLVIPGRILLLAKYGDSESAESRVLADCALSPWLQHELLKEGDRVTDVAKAVRNSAADAFMDVLPDLFAPKHEVTSPDLFETEPAEPRHSVGVRRDRARPSGLRNHASRLQRWKPWFAVGGVVVAIWIFLSIVAKPAQPQQQTLTANTPEAQTMLPSQLQPQTGADAQAQVDLVKSTLKSMGLDPGASGDTGCLVQPH